MTSDKFLFKRRQVLGLVASTAVLPHAAKITASEESAPDSAPPTKIPDLKDPNLIKPSFPWALLLNNDELATIAALCDMIIPADNNSPSAAAVGVHNYINQHVSAPYPKNKEDLIEIQGGIVWLNTESVSRFNKVFAALDSSEKTAICNDICKPTPESSEFQLGARFFSKIRNMTAAGYFTTQKGMTYVGYVGNTPRLEFPPPPESVLKKLGLEKISKQYESSNKKV